MSAAADTVTPASADTARVSMPETADNVNPASAETKSEKELMQHIMELEGWGKFIRFTQFVYTQIYPHVKSMPLPDSVEGWSFRVPVGAGHTVSVAVPPDSNKSGFDVVETLVFDADGKARYDLPEELGYGTAMGVNYFSTAECYIQQLVLHIADLRKYFGWTSP